jgi:AraC-like DNA-binding protein
MSSSPYREWRPPLELAGEVACLWSGSVGVVGIDHADRVLPDACVDVIWDGTRLFVAGPDTGPVPIAPAPPRTYVGVRLRPGHAGRVLGRPACEIRDRRLNLAELWDRPAVDSLTDEVAAAANAAQVADALRQAVRLRLTASRADTLVDGLVAALEGATECAGPGLVARLAADLGASERSLHRRCVAAVGYGPKTLDRVLRFCRARRLARVLPATSLAALAAAAGYADQAHLTRDWRRLDGRTPSESFKIARRRAAKLSP